MLCVILINAGRMPAWLGNIQLSQKGPSATTESAFSGEGGEQFADQSS